MDPIEGMKIAAVESPAADKVAQPDKSGGGTSFKDVLADKMGDAPKPQDGARPTSVAPVRERVETFVSGVLDDEKALDRAMSRAASGAPMQNHELLELQALMYGYAQKVDIATKVVEKAAGGVKQLMQTQV